MRSFNKNPAVARVSWPYRLYPNPKASVRLPVTKRKRFPRVTTVSCTLR